MDGACGEIVATKSIFLRKKSYFDLLQSTGKDGKTITGAHVRMKGITKEGLEFAKERAGSFLKLYTKLAEGKEIEIELNPVN